MRFTLRQLTVFSVLASTSHFGHAADLLQLSQPTVSSDIKALERGLKVRLFDRSRAGTALTVAGEKVLPYACAVLEAAQELDQVSEVVASGRSHRIRVAVTPSLVNRLIPNLLQELANSREGLHIEIEEVPTGGVAPAIVSGTADLGLGHFVSTPHGCTRATVGFDQLWLLTEAGELSADEPAPLSSMKSRKLLIWPREQNPDYYDFLMKVCQKGGMAPITEESPLRISGAYSYLLTSGRAFALVPEDYARDTPATLSCAPLLPPAQVPLHAVWKQSAAPVVRELLSMLQRIQRMLSTKGL